MSSVDNISLTPQWVNDVNNIWYLKNGCCPKKDNTITEYLEEWKSPCYDKNKDYINFRIDKNKEEENDTPILEFYVKPYKIAYKIFYKIGNWKEYIYPHMYQLNDNMYDYSDFESDEYDQENENNEIHNNYDYDDDEYYKNSIPDYS
jgi:hypothetical protein